MAESVHLLLTYGLYIVDANHSTLAALAQNILLLEMTKFSQKINLWKNNFFGLKWKIFWNILFLEMKIFKIN
jgi:hypothetical protein